MPLRIRVLTTPGRVCPQVIGAVLQHLADDVSRSRRLLHGCSTDRPPDATHDSLHCLGIGRRLTMPCQCAHSRLPHIGARWWAFTPALARDERNLATVSGVAGSGARSRALHQAANRRMSER